MSRFYKHFVQLGTIPLYVFTVSPEAMGSDTDDLTAIFLDISGEETLTERQEEAPSHAPIEADDDAVDVTEDGLEDAVDVSFERVDSR